MTLYDKVREFAKFPKLFGETSDGAYRTTGGFLFSNKRGIEFYKRDGIIKDAALEIFTPNSSLAINHPYRFGYKIAAIKFYLKDGDFYRITGVGFADIREYGPRDGVYGMRRPRLTRYDPREEFCEESIEFHLDETTDIAKIIQQVKDIYDFYTTL